MNTFGVLYNGIHRFCLLTSLRNYSFLLFLFFFGGNSFATLNVEPPEVTLTELNSQERATTTFLISNDSDEALEIIEVSADCACLSYILSDRFIQPRKTVRLWAEYGVKDGGGDTSHEIVLFAKGRGDTLVKRIPVHVKIPMIFEISNRRLVWGTDDVKPQSVELKILKSSGVEFVRAQVYGSKPDGFSFLISERDTDDAEYRYIDMTVAPTVPATLTPEKVGAVGFVGIELKKGDKPLKTMFEVISWPDLDAKTQ
jgi:hypothetical protein